MKKLTLVFVAAFALLSTKAQVRFGLKAGANFATVHGKDDDGAKTKAGFYGGVFAGLPIAGGFSLQPELVYSMQGTKAQADPDPGGSTEGPTKVFVNYLNVPVMLKYSSSVGLFAETGPQAGFLLHSKAKEEDVSVDLKDTWKSLDFGWCLGVGYLVKPAHLGIDVRYNLGVSNIVKDSDNGDLKNGVFQVGLFYVFSGK